MVATPGNEEPPFQKRNEPGRRRRPRRREPPRAWWALFGVWAAVALWAWSWRLALLGLLLWCLYEFVLVPTVCRVMTRQGLSCREPVRGRLFACRAEHQRAKTEAVWRLAGTTSPFRNRKKPVADPDPETGQMGVSPVARERLAQADMLLILCAAAGTLVATVGMIWSYAA